MGDVLTPKEAAEKLKLNEKTVLQLLRSGELPGRHLGRQWRIPEDALMEYLEGDFDREPLSKEDLAAVKESVEAFERGEYVTLDELDRDLEQQDRRD